MASVPGSSACGCEGGCNCTVIAGDNHIGVQTDGTNFVLTFLGVSYDNDNLCGIELDGTGIDTDPLCGHVCQRTMGAF